MLFDLDRQVLLSGVLVGSFIELWAAIAICAQLDEGSGAAYGTSSRDCSGKFAWAVACGLFGCLLSAAMLVLNKCKPEAADGVVSYVIFSALFGLWVVGVAVGTMDKPFAPSGNDLYSNSYGVAGNGYIATWMALFFSCILFFGHVKPVAVVMKGAFGQLDNFKKMLLAIALASLIEFWHAARICDDVAHCEGMLAWGVSAGVISAGLILVFGVLMRVAPAVSEYVKYFAAFLALWWIAAVCSLTMPNGNTSCSGNDAFCRGLFLSASNGFFGTWVAMLLSVVLTAQLFGVALPGLPPAGQPSAPTQPAPTSMAVAEPAAATSPQPDGTPSADKACPADALDQV